MHEQAKHKDVEIEGQSYRIGLLTAEIGNWMGLQVLAGRLSDPDVHGTVLHHCLAVCSHLKQQHDGERIPVKIFALPDKWIDERLKYDLLTVSDLMTECMDFNLGPFLERLKARGLAAQQTTTPPNSPKD